MARHPFGGTTADFVESVRTDGTLQADVGATCTFFTAQTGGLAIVDLQDMNGNPITSVAADGFGWIPPFMGPNDGSAQMWVSAGGSARQLIQATDTPARVGALEVATGTGARALPGTPMVGLGSLSQLTGVYTPPTASLTKWRSIVGKALAGVGVAEITFIGPSTTMGAPAGVPTSAPWVLVNLLQALGLPAAHGYAQVASSTTTIPTSTNDSRWTFPDGGWALYSTAVPFIPIAVSSVSGARAIFTSLNKGTIVEFMVVGVSGAYTYSIDGAAAVPVSAQASGTFATPVVVTGLANTVHTLVITPTTTSAVNLAKARVRNASGILVNNAGWSGAAAEDWDNTDATITGNTVAAQFGLPNLAAKGLTGPGLVIIDAALLINSYLNNTGHTPNYTTALGQAALGRLITQWQAGGANDVVLTMPTAPSTTVQFGSYPVISDATFEPYRQIAYTLADTYGCFLLDNIVRVGLWATANANGMKADAFHDTPSGYAEMATGIATLLAPHGGGTVNPLELPALTAKITANASTTSTAATDSGLALSFPAVAGGVYRVEAKVQLGNTVANNQATAQLTDAANTVYDTQGYSPTVVNGTAVFPLWAELVAPSNGTQTFKIRLLTAAGGTAFLLAGATFPNVLRVTRVG